VTIERLRAPCWTAADESTAGAAISHLCERGGVSDRWVTRISRLLGVSHELTHHTVPTTPIVTFPTLDCNFGDSSFVAFSTHSSRFSLPKRLKPIGRFKHFAEYGTIYVSSICQKQVTNKNIQLVILIAN